MRNRCDEMRMRIFALVEGEYQERPDEQRAVLAHLDVCPTCHAHYTVLLRTRHCLPHWVTPEPARDLSARFAQRLEDHVSARQQPVRRWRLGWTRTAWAMSAMLALMVAGILLRPSHRAPSPVALIPKSVSVIMPVSAPHNRVSVAVPVTKHPETLVQAARPTQRRVHRRLRQTAPAPAGTSTPTLPPAGTKAPTPVVVDTTPLTVAMLNEAPELNTNPVESTTLPERVQEAAAYTSPEEALLAYLTETN